MNTKNNFSYIIFNAIISFIQYFYNDTKARDLPIFKEALKISAISFSNNNGINLSKAMLIKRLSQDIYDMLLKPFFLL